MYSEAAALLRPAIHSALQAVDAPIDVLIDSIILSYAIDRSTIAGHYRSVSGNIAAQLALLTERKETADCISTTARYSSFVSDDWLIGVRDAKSRNIFRYQSIAYDGANYDCFIVRVDKQAVAELRGCPSSSAFRICRLSVTKFIEACNFGVEATAVLTNFAATGVFNEPADWTVFFAGIPSRPTEFIAVLPAIHAYVRLTRIVRRGICLRSSGICDVCRLKKPPAVPLAATTAALLLPFPNDLYDDDG